MTEPKTATGRAKVAQIEAVKEDFVHARSLLADLIDHADQLATEAAGLNGLATYWRGVRQQMEESQKAMDAKLSEAVARLEGKGPKPEIRAEVDAEQAEKVKQARDGEAA